MATKSISNKLGISSMKTFNRIFAGIFALEAIAIVSQADKITIPVVQQFLVNNSGTSSSQEVFSLVIPTILSFILLATAASYLVLSTTGIGWYIKSITHKMNYMRWLQFSISGSMMIALVALVSGFNDLLSLIMIVFVAISSNLYGVLMEKINERRKHIEWRPFIFSVGMNVSMVAVLFLAYIFTKTSVSIAPSGSIIWMYITLGIMYIGYGLTMLAHYSKFSIWKNYLIAEETFMLIDLACKSAICWMIYFAIS